MKIKILVLIGLVLLGSACSDDFLEKTPDKALAVPDQLADLRALLENTNMFSSLPGLSDLGCDEYTLSYNNWQAQGSIWRNAYTWQADIFEGRSSSDWNNAYRQVYVCNVVLRQLDELEITTQQDAEYREIKGTAYFYRAVYLHRLQEVFGKPYVPATAESDPGICLRVSDDVNERLSRATVEETFTQIASDLQGAYSLLSEHLPEANFRYRPSKATAAAMLARIYLLRQDYQRAKAWADAALSLYDYLNDYEALDTTSTRPFNAPAIDEVLWQAYQIDYGLISSFTVVDSALYASYAPDDLRKPLYFRLNDNTQTHYFKGSYSGTVAVFGGIANDEVYLTRAECLVRMGQLAEAVDDLNTLLRHRWKGGTYLPVRVEDGAILLQQIMAERRKELLFRGLRWSDLRRLNQEPTFAKPLSRVLNGEMISLQPNDLRYTYPIPPTELLQNDLIQNDR